MAPTALIPAGCGGSQTTATEAPDEDTLALLERAEEHERQRRYDLARASYRQAVLGARGNRSAADAAHRFASALAFWGELPQAIAMLERAVAFDERRADSWHDLGVLRASSGDYVGAESALRRARTAANRDPRPRIALAALLVKLKRFGDARAEYKALLELELPDNIRTAVNKALELLAAEQ